MEKPAAERVLMAWDAAVAAKRRVEGVGLDPIALIQRAERGEDVGDSQEVAELIEAYGRLRKELDNLASEGFGTQA